MKHFNLPIVFLTLKDTIPSSVAFVNGCTNDGLVLLGVCDAPNWRDSVHAACNGISGVIQNLDTC